MKHNSLFDANMLTSANSLLPISKKKKKEVQFMLHPSSKEKQTIYHLTFFFLNSWHSIRHFSCSSVQPAQSNVFLLSCAVTFALFFPLYDVWQLGVLSLLFLYQCVSAPPPSLELILFLIVKDGSTDNNAQNHNAQLECETMADTRGEATQHVTTTEYKWMKPGFT